MEQKVHSTPIYPYFNTGTAFPALSIACLVAPLSLQRAIPGCWGQWMCSLHEMATLSSRMPVYLALPAAKRRSSCCSTEEITRASGVVSPQPPMVPKVAEDQGPSS